MSFESTPQRVVLKVNNDSYSGRNLLTFKGTEVRSDKSAIPTRRVLSRSLIMEFRTHARSGGYLSGTVALIAEDLVDEISIVQTYVSDKLGRKRKGPLEYVRRQIVEKLDEVRFDDYYFGLPQSISRSDKSPKKKPEWDQMGLFRIAVSGDLGPRALEEVGHQLLWKFVMKAEATISWLFRWFPDLARDYMYHGWMPRDREVSRVKTSGDLWILVGPIKEHQELGKFPDDSLESDW